MARILVVFGTTEGQTAKIGEALAAAMREQGADVDVIDAAAQNPSPEPYIGIVVAASVHAGAYQRRLRRWVRTHVAVLQARRTAFVSVCLGVLEHNPATDRELQAIVDRFVSSTGWQPGVTKHVAGALPYRKYNWLKRWLMLRIVRKAGGDTDTSRDYEYTDWEDVRRFAIDFARRLEAEPANSSTAPQEIPAAPAAPLRIQA
jgi:menaquinone-dependent protoporphyrinogen oxidase